jgi:hypothetical protein
METAPAMDSGNTGSSPPCKQDKALLAPYFTPAPQNVWALMQLQCASKAVERVKTRILTTPQVPNMCPLGYVPQRSGCNAHSAAITAVRTGSGAAVHAHT